ncbi:MAG: alkaline phosphatase family protein [Acidimicrobiales bacterium]
MAVSRRAFLAGVAASGAAARVGGLPGIAAGASPQIRPPRLPAPARSGIEHIVVLCMENRSFDHFLGWVPKARGRQAGLTYADDEGELHRTHHLEEWTGCGFNDPDHSYSGGRVQLAQGRVDGFRLGRNDDYALGYFKGKDLATTSQLVSNFTICDRWFASFLGPTFPNRLYTHSAATDRISNTFDPCLLPTIWDRLATAGVPANYYFSDLPFLGLYEGRYAPISRPLTEFFVQAGAGTLPPYSYLDPSFIGATQNDDHPHADIRRGQNLVGRIVKALLESPQWSSTVLIVTYDEWGGFFDHVRPPRLPDDVAGAGTADHAQAGFRVPAYIVSPFARPGRVAGRTFDHSAILKFVEWRFGLKPLTKRDRASNNLAHVLDFTRPNLVPPELKVPADPGPSPCLALVSPADEESLWRDFASSRRLTSWG